MGNTPYARKQNQIRVSFLSILMVQTDRCVILFMKNLYSSLFSQASGGLLILSCKTVSFSILVNCNVLEFFLA